MEEQELKRISMTMMDFCDGDLLFLSDLSDNLLNFRNNYNSESRAYSIISFTIQKIDKDIKGEAIPALQDIITDGLDLLARIVEDEDSELKQHLAEEIDEYLNGTKEYNLSALSVEQEAQNVCDKLEPKSLNQSDSVKQISHDISVDMDSDTFKVFISESKSRINECEELLMDLESDLTNKEIIALLFRIYHTIKGESGFLKIYKLGEFTHNIENLLDMIRNNELENSTEITDILFKGTDYLKEIIAALDLKNMDTFERIDLNAYLQTIENAVSGTKESIGTILQREKILSDQEIKEIADKQQQEGYLEKFGEIALNDKYIDKETLDATLNKQKADIKEKTKTGDTFIKVKSSQINYLVDMIGELLITENQLEDKNIDKLKKITMQIQDAAMTLRTVKVRSLFINMKRVVRDLSKQKGKNIEVELIGEDLEIDRNLVDSLEAPLTHMLRNSVGHGIELKGKITLMAARRGNNIVISIIDDGKGLDKEKILNKAVSKGLILESRAGSLSNSEIFDFIFKPGFSTAAVVDDVSGRGVGMDVVLTTVSSMRGRIKVDSSPGKGTKIDLIYPLSMAIIDGMIIRLEKDFYIIPVTEIIECLKINMSELYTVNGTERVMKLREEIIPVVDLHTFFNKETDKDRDFTLAVVIEKDSKKYTFLADEVIAKKEVVIKPLGAKFKKLKGISSATVLPGGKIGLIINIEDLLNWLLTGKGNMV